MMFFHWDKDKTGHLAQHLQVLAVQVEEPELKFLTIFNDPNR